MFKPQREPLIPMLTATRLRNAHVRAWNGRIRLKILPPITPPKDAFGYNGTLVLSGPEYEALREQMRINGTMER